MKRSAFLKSSLAAAGLTSAATAAHAAPGAANSEPVTQEYIEVRKYSLTGPEKLPLLESYLRDAAIPALNRLGVKAVGVFHLEKSEQKPVVFVVLLHRTLEQFGKTARLLDDPKVASVGGAYLAVAATEPIYERVESWLTRSIAGMPSMNIPAKGNGIYQLRIYESHSEQAARKKIEMFNTGELEIFRRAGLAAVFFGETVVGPAMPNLTYMLSFADMAAKDAAWKTFSSDPAWAKLKTTPGFTDKEIVSKITNLILIPAPYSQI
jgi:hypothetical protein